MKSISVKRKKLGRPATGTAPLYGVRIPDGQMKLIDKWAAANEALSRSEAIRRLVEIGLNMDRPAGRPSSKTAARAAELAAKVIDGHVKGAPDGEVRKRRILKGPSVFRGVRKDRS